MNSRWLVGMCVGFLGAVVGWLAVPVGGAGRLLSAADMRDNITGRIVDCTHSYGQSTCNDIVATCGKKKTLAECTGACTGCTGSGNTTVCVSGGRLTIVNCQNNPDDDGCGTHFESGTQQCTWNAGNNICNCHGGTQGDVDCTQNNASGSTNCTPKGS